MSEIRKVGIVGAGTMGNGIAQACAVRGIDVVMLDISEAAVQKGVATVAGSLDRLIKKEKMSAGDKDTALARISTSTDIAALAVPLSALTEVGGKPAVWVLREGTATPVAVEAGAYSETDVPVLSGLKPDDWVVISGVHLLRENDAVKPVDRENRPVRVDAAREPAVAEDASAALEAGADRIDAAIAG